MGGTATNAIASNCIISGSAATIAVSPDNPIVYQTSLSAVRVAKSNDLNKPLSTVLLLKAVSFVVP